jgi:adenosylcobinamide kinase / adenosylcobinamide-phosphate guanylyltransferase
MPGTGPSPSAALHIERLTGGLDITSPDGSRLLLAGGPGEVPEPQPGAAAYDVALLDLLASPAQLGRLRASGLVHSRTAVAALYTDHRISSAPELARRCELWGADQAHDGQLITAPAAAGWPSGATRPHRTLIIGGARSGKSTEAELRLAAEPRVTYVAAGPFGLPDTWTGPDGQPDVEWARRVAIHRARRPSWWRTVETLDIGGILRAEDGALLIDGIGTWLAAVLAQAGMWDDDDPVTAAARRGDLADQVPPDPAEVVQAKIGQLVGAWCQTSALVVAVTDEVGSGLVPAYPAGRVFRDQLGWLNQRLATESELNLHVVAGRLTTLSG